MLNKIKAQLSNITFKEENSSELFVVDRKNFDGGDVEIYNQKPEFEFVYLKNENKVELNFVGFLDNALEIKVGNYAKQTECLIFPKTENEKDWFLTIETKYSSSEENVFRISNKYPEIVIEKIVDTIDFLRTEELISKSKKVHAMVSFPKLFKDFSESFFTGDFDLDEIFFNHKIIIKATNKAEIISSKRIKI